MPVIEKLSVVMSNLVKKLFALVFIGFSLHLVIIYYTPSLMMKFIGKWEEQNMINNSFARDLPDSEF